MYDRLEARLASIQFRILVWGPTPTAASPAAGKRHDIRRGLVAKGHEALFSEDIPLPPRAPGLPVDVWEMAQLGECQFVVNVADSPGSLGEAHQFGLLTNNRMLLWLPEAARRGFAGQGLARTRQAADGTTVYYKADDLASCVVSLLSVDWIEARRVLTWYSREQRERLRALDPFEN